jgi:AraC-like DNA-binding protein
MNVDKFLPEPVLTPYVKEFLVIDSDQEFDNTLIPDVSIVLSFRFRGVLLALDADREDAFPTVVISGLRKTARQIRYAGGSANFMVIFREGGIAAFSRMGAHELFGLSIPGENIFSGTELAGITERLAEAATNQERAAIVNDFLIGKLAAAKPDPEVDKAIQWIKKQSGIIRIKDLASALYISQDAFEKRFRMRIGATPRQYASVVRLRHLIKTYPSLSSLTEASYEAGYFDQSHFIKDFRGFTGQSPSGFFKNSRFW